MSGDPTPIEISADAFGDAIAHAVEVFPAECCGWMTGPTDGSAVDRTRRCDNAQSAGDHPTAADRSAETAYVIAGDDLLAFNKAIDDRERPARLIYHSHPNGRAYFSATDREVARSPFGDGPAYPVQQLVIGLDAERVTEAALFAWSDEAADFIEVQRWPLNLSSRAVER